MVSADEWTPPVLLLPDAPEVPRWIRADPGPVRSLAGTLGSAAQELRRTANLVQGLLVDAAGVLGWRSNAAGATSARAAQTGGRLSQAAARIDDAATAISTLAGRLAEGSIQIETLLRRRSQITDDANVVVVQPLSAGGPNPADQVAAVDQQIRAEVQSLIATDRAVAEHLGQAGEVLRSLAGAGARDGWVTSLAVPEVFGVLTRYGVLAEQSADWTGPVDWDQLADSPLLREVRSGAYPFGPGVLEPRLQDVLAELPPRATNQDRSRAVAAWFAGLTALQQVWYTQESPDLIGNLDGIPFGARDQANRVRLVQALADLNAMARQFPAGLDPIFMTSDQAARYHIVQDRLASLRVIEQTMQREDRHLVTLDLAMNGGHVKAAVAIGDLDHATNVAVFVPGLTTTVSGSLLSYDGRLRDLRRVANREAFANQRPTDVAMVTWIGYDAPQWNELTTLSHSVALDLDARTGSKALNSFLAGISADRVDDPHVTVLAHSYGSLTASLALQKGHDGVDDVVLFGSPGLDTDDIKDLQVPAGHTFVLEDRQDPVADLASFGPDPNQMKGVTQLSTAATRTADGVLRRESVGHSDYLSEQTTSQYNMASVVVGLPELAAHGGQYGIGDAWNFSSRLEQWLR